MRTETAPVIRLEDYRPSDFLIDRVELDLRLDPKATRVTATLALRPNPAGLAGAPLVLDGDELTLRALALDGRALPAGSYEATPQSLTVPEPPRRPFTLSIETEIDPTANTKLMGLYRSSGTFCTQCEAEGFRRITYFLDRPDVLAVYTARIDADATSAGAPRQRQPGRERHVEARPALRGLARPASRSPPISSPWSAGDLGCVHDSFTTMSAAARSRSAIYVRARQGGPRGLRHGRAEALHGLGRAPLRPRVRPRRVQHRRRVRLQLRGDGEQGPQHLQRQAGARRARDRHRRRLRQRSRRHRPRVFPQLDRQPDHLPRLVPALPQGRPDGLPRPGVLVRRALAPVHRIEDVRDAPRAPVRRGRGPPRPPGAADAVHEDQQLLHGDRLREGRRDRPHAEDAPRRGRLPHAAWTSISSAATARRRRSRISSPASPKLSGRDLSAFTRWYEQAGHAARVGQGAPTTRRPELPSSTSRRRRRRRRASRRRSPWPSRSRSASLRRMEACSTPHCDRIGAGRRVPARQGEDGLTFTDVRHAARAFTLPRLLRSGESGLDLSERLSAGSPAPRYGSVQSLAGGADGRAAPSGRAFDGCQRRRRRRTEASRRPCRLSEHRAQDPAFAALVLTLPSEADIARRSPATSIRMRCTAPEGTAPPDRRALRSPISWTSARRPARRRPLSRCRERGRRVLAEHRPRPHRLRRPALGERWP